MLETDWFDYILEWEFKHRKVRWEGHRLTEVT